MPAYCEIDFPHPAQPERLRAIFSDAECILRADAINEVPGLLARAETYALAGHWVVGFVAYEAAQAFDAALHTHDTLPAGFAFAQFAVYRNVAATTRARAEHLSGMWRDDTRRKDFEAAVDDIKLGITAGDYYQVNYTTRLHAPFLGDGLSFFDSLRASQPAAYCAYLDFGPWQICSVSPELFFHWKPQHGALTCRPMKGTAARHSDPVRDSAAARALQQSPKECAENLMIVDLVRNDLSRVAQPGTVHVPQLFSVEAWPTVWQMTSTVSCQTKSDTGLRDVFHALFPCGSVTGAPKAAAMSTIHTLETSPRGVYCGAIGLVMPGGEALFSVGIRTSVIDTTLGIAECGVGSGITLDSTAAQERAEWRAKQVFLMQACPEYELLETLRLHQGRYWLLRGHLQRLQRSALSLGFTCDISLITSALQLTAKQHPSGQWLVRLRLSPQGEINMEALPLDTLPAAPQIALAKAAVTSSNPWLYHKTTQRGLYAALMNDEKDGFDTLLYNERGELTEFTRGNLVVELHGKLITPAAQCGLLPGVLREVLLRRKRIHEGIATLDDLKRAETAWFINSVRGAVRVSVVT